MRGIGRPQKIDRQEMVGAVAAVRRWVTMNHEERLADAERKTRTILAPLQGVPGVKARFIDNIIGHMPYGLDLEVDEDATGISVFDVVDRLKAGDPPIWTRVREGESWITIHVFGLKDPLCQYQMAKDKCTLTKLLYRLCGNSSVGLSSC